MPACGSFEAVAEEQTPVTLSDVCWDDPVSAEAVRLESVVTLDRPHTDLIVNGCAVAPRGRPARVTDVSLRYQGQVLKHLRVFGDRRWYRGALGWNLTAPEPFEQMPITYARAYGGRDEHGGELRNPIGAGYTSRADSSFEGARAANVEAPSQLVASPDDRPTPVGLGVVPRGAKPRIDYAGTYDDAWLETRYPLLPEDFDDRFHQCADRAQWLETPRGGDVLEVTGMSEEPVLAMALPDCQMQVGYHFTSRSQTGTMHLDTVILDTQARTLNLTWSDTVVIHGDPFALKETVVDAREVGRSAVARCC